MKKIPLLIALCISLYSCDYLNKLKPSGKIVTKEIVQDPIYTIDNSSNLEIEFTNDIPKNTVLIKGDEVYIENLLTSFESGTILFSNKENTSANTSDVKILINAPEIKTITSSGTSNIVSSDYIFKNNLTLNISGAGNMKITATNKDTEVNISGTGDVHLEGKSDNLYSTVSGTGNLSAKTFECKNINITISGVGNATVNASQSLNAIISGTGNLSYKNFPDLKINQNVSGIGSIHSY